jgi:HEAT repeat protein
MPQAVPRNFAMLCGLSALLLTEWFFAQIPASRPPSESVSEIHLIEGRTLDEWRELMKSVDLNDPERGNYVPALIQIAHSPQIPWFTRRQAAQTLGRWGAPAVAAVPVLERLLEESADDAEETTVFWALKGLSLFGPLAAPAVPNVSRIALNPNQPDGHRLAAMECLSQVGVAHFSGAATLIQIAQISKGDDRATVRRGAVEAIGLFRGGASIAIPTLLRCLDDTDHNIRREAAVSLGRQGEAAEIAQPALFDLMMGDSDPGVRDAAGFALSQTGPQALPTLVEILEAEDSELRRRAAQVIGQFGRRGKSAAPALLRLWEAPEEEVRLAALEATWKTTGMGTVIAPRIAELLTSKERNIRRQAFLLLTSLGDAGASARPILQRQLNHPRAEVRSVARKLLEQFTAQ